MARLVVPPAFASFQEQIGAALHRLRMAADRIDSRYLVVCHYYGDDSEVGPIRMYRKLSPAIEDAFRSAARLSQAAPWMGAPTELPERVDVMWYGSGNFSEDPQAVLTLVDLDSAVEITVRHVKETRS